MIAIQPRRCAAKLLWATILLATIHFSLSAVVLAHADYDSSVPAADEVVSQVPQQVQVWFTQEMFRREGQNSLEVFGPDEQRVDLDDVAIDDDDRKLMTVSLQSDLPDGVYTVRWRTLSADDGDDADGEFQFTIQADGPEGEETPAAAPAPTATTAAETGLPPPTATAQAESEEPQAAAPTAEPTPEGAESPPGQADQGPAFPCLGGSAPALFLLGAFLLARRRARPGERPSNGIARFLSAWHR